MLSRSFSVPKETVGPDPMGDVSMQSTGDGPNEQDADMSGQDDLDDGTRSAPEDLTQADENLEPDEDEEDDGEGSDDDDGSEAEQEEEVMVPVADILNAAYDLDNVRVWPRSMRHILTSGFVRLTCYSRTDDAR